MYVAGDTHRRNGQHEHPQRNALEAEELLPAPYAAPHPSPGDAPLRLVATDWGLEAGEMCMLVSVARERRDDGLRGIGRTRGYSCTFI